MIEREVRDGIAILRLAHGKASALDTELMTALARAFEQEEQGLVRAVVLTGTGPIFCAGVDLVRVAQGGRDYLRAFLPALDEGLRRLFAFPKPVVAAINGHAIAGGCILAAACDRRLMALGEGLVGVPELLVGVPFPGLALEILRDLLSPGEFREAVLTGATHTPEAALAYGFVDELVDHADLIDRAVAAATQLARVPRSTYALTKSQLRLPVVEAVARSAALDGEARDVWLSEGALESIRAYVARTLKK